MYVFYEDPNEDKSPHAITLIEIDLPTPDAMQPVGPESKPFRLEASFYELAGSLKIGTKQRVFDFSAMQELLPCVEASWERKELLTTLQCANC